MRTKHGYTLIEMLLVISLITTLCTLSVRWYRQHWWDQHIQNTSVEMENVLVASLNYQAEHDAWPETHQDLASCWQTSPSEDDFVQFYLPLHKEKNKFGSYYCYGHSNHVFWTALHLNATQATQAGARLLTQLPNAHLTSDPLSADHPPCDAQSCFLMTEVAAHTSSAQSSAQVVGLGQCNPNAEEQNNTTSHCKWVKNQGPEPNTVVYWIAFDCPALTEKKIMATVNFLDVGKANGEPYVLRTLTLDTDCQHEQGCFLNIRAARSDGHSVSSGAYGHVGASYMAICQTLSAEAPSSL